MPCCILLLFNSLQQLRVYIKKLRIHIFAAVVQKNRTSIVRSGFRDRETFVGEKALNKVLFLICLSLQETVRALCCKVSASCLPLFLPHSFSSPFLSPFFPPPALRVIEFIPHGKRTTSGPTTTTTTDTRHIASSAPMLHLWQLWVTMLVFLIPR